MQPEDQITQRIVDKVMGGVHPNVAARACGITDYLFRLWMERGELEEQGIYADFYNKVMQADALNEVALVQGFMKAAEDDWKATEAFLKRRFPKTWGDRSSLQITNPKQDSTPQLDVRKALMDTEVRGKVAELFKVLTESVSNPPVESNTVEGEFKEIDEKADDSGPS